MCTKIWIYHEFWHSFDNVLSYMFSATLKHTIKQKYYQTKLEKTMLCQMWQFQLRNTLKLSRHFDVMFHMFMAIKKTFNRYKNCSLDKTEEGYVVSDLAILPQKYFKIGTQEKDKCLHHCFLKLCCFFTEFWRRFSHVLVHKSNHPPKKKIAGIKLENKMWC